MQTTEELIEKYKNDMLGMMKRSYFPYEDDPAVKSVQANVPAQGDFVSEENSDDKEKSEQNLNVRETKFVPTNEPVQANDFVSFVENLPESKNEAGEQAYGSLKVRAFSGNIAYPIETAFVRIFDFDGRTVEEGYTDQSGIFDAQNLPVPDKSISETPNGEKGYATYKIVVTHPRFNTKIFENVPVFADVESIQDVRMELGDPKDEILTVESEPDSLRRGQNAE